MAYMTDENGNYKRTVRCGYCYEKGHNRSACPKRKTDLQESVKRYTKELAETDRPADDYQVRNAERYLQHAKNELHKIGTRGKNRKCGFCGEEGHTRRTCSHRKIKVAEQLKKTLDVRKRVADRMIDDGFGPGALIKVKNQYTGDESMAVVSDIKFKDIAPNSAVSKESYFYGAQAVRYELVVPVTDRWSGVMRGGMCYVPLDYMNIDDIPFDEWYRQPNNHDCTLLSGVDVSEDALLTEETYGDKKEVEKWVIQNIVDPK